MNCKTCNYSLWNNTTGHCPECGSPFKPSDFDFVPGSVRFCCPHCSQHYFGTDSRGQLQPREFVCVNCSRPIDMDQMVLMPEIGVADDATQQGRLAWTDSNLGFFTRWWRTTVSAMIRPHKLGMGIPPGQGSLASWWFAILTNLIITLVTFGYIIVLMALMLGFAPAGAGGPPLWAMTSGLSGFALGIGLIGYPILILLWGLGAHLILSIGTTKPAHSLRHTYATLCLASGANLINVIPCVGMYSIVGGLWWTISTAIALKYSQRVPTYKAILAAVIPPLVFLCTCVGAYMGLIFMMLPSISRATAMAQAAAAPADLSLDYKVTSSVTKALTKSASNTNSWPNHVFQLVVTKELDDDSFTLTASGTTPDKIPLAGTNLGQRAFLPTTEVRRLSAAMGVTPPPPVYRCGDFVFTYQGIPVTAPTPAPDGAVYSELWIVISSIDPNSPPPPPPGVIYTPYGKSPLPSTATAPVEPRAIYVGKVDGVVLPFAPEDFPKALASQNELRALFGLPPIPSPETLPQWTLPQK